MDRQIGLSHSADVMDGPLSKKTNVCFMMVKHAFYDDLKSGQGFKAPLTSIINIL